MAQKGGRIMKAVVSDGTDTVVYSKPVLSTRGVTLSFQFDVTETAATYGGVITLWATDISDAIENESDTGWVQMTTAHGWNGFPSLTAGAIADGDSDSLPLGNCGAYAYRLRVERTGGAATINAYTTIKDNS